MIRVADWHLTTGFGGVGYPAACAQLSRRPVLSYRVEVPPNALASVHVPSAEAGLVRDASGDGPASVAEYPGLRGASEAVFEVGPGGTSSRGRTCEPPGSTGCIVS